MSLHLLAETSALRLPFDCGQQGLFAQWGGAPTAAERARGYDVVLAARASCPSRRLLTDSSDVAAGQEWSRAAWQQRQRFWRRAAALDVQFLAEVVPRHSSGAPDTPAPELLWVATFEEVSAACTWPAHHPIPSHPKVSRAITPTPSPPPTTTRRPSLFRFHFSTLRRVLPSPASAPLALVGPALI